MSPNLSPEATGPGAPAHPEPCYASLSRPVSRADTRLPASLLDFCRRLPKVELHAHLNGCIRDATIRELVASRDGQPCGDQNCETRLEEVLRKGERRLEECFVIFDAIHRVSTDHEVVRRVAKEAVEDFASDGVAYLELRTTPKARPEGGMTKESYLQAVMDGLEEGKRGVAGREREATEEGKSTRGMREEGDWIGGIEVRVLLSVDRRESSEEAMETVELAGRWRGRGVVGIDLSGNPAVGQLGTWRPALEAAKAGGLRITMHCAEVVNYEETRQMLEMAPHRLGHFCCVDEGLEAELRRQGIPLELCLTSNVLTKSVGSYSEHHFGRFYNRGHPVVLCTDDSGVFSTTLSREYALAASAFNLSPRRLYDLAGAAVEYVFEGDDVRGRLRQLLKEFEAKHLA